MTSPYFISIETMLLDMFGKERYIYLVLHKHPCLKSVNHRRKILELEQREEANKMMITYLGADAYNEAVDNRGVRARFKFLD